jgi:hypothetical protein
MAAEPKAEGKPKPATAATLGDRLSRSEPREARQE